MSKPCAVVALAVAAQPGATGGGVDKVAATEAAVAATSTVLGAEHAIIASCDTMPWMAETPFNLWICYDPVWDKARGQDLINHFATAFLLVSVMNEGLQAT